VWITRHVCANKDLIAPFHNCKVIGFEAEKKFLLYPSKNGSTNFESLLLKFFAIHNGEVFDIVLEDRIEDP
jgi:hypothetical protein